MSTDAVSLGDAIASLTFSDLRFDASGFAMLDVRLRGPGLDASLGCYVHDPRELAQYFRSLDAGWRGWSGERRYASLEGEVVLSARHGRRIEIATSLGFVPGGDVSVGWSCTAGVSVEPGEQLAGFVRDFDGFLAASTR
ncbi:DUF6228 family protein [Microbacterium sp. NPDC089696]|uniref:DUF6228 family protein n=1 Tax=Microbacterium sp. NPDC089696 TaxID=3364199 RepID=UPI0038065FC6